MVSTMETDLLSDYPVLRGQQKSSTCLKTTSPMWERLPSLVHLLVSELSTIYLFHHLTKKSKIGRSDYGPFLEVNIPAGGLFTGAEVVKTAQEAVLFGGQAGMPYGG